MGKSPKIRGTFLGVPIIRIILFWGLYWGPPILGNCHIRNKGIHHIGAFQGSRSLIPYEPLVSLGCEGRFSVPEENAEPAVSGDSGRFFQILICRKPRTPDGHGPPPK